MYQLQRDKSYKNLPAMAIAVMKPINVIDGS
jgi:hypothetical protein